MSSLELTFVDLDGGVQAEGLRESSNKLVFGDVASSSRVEMPENAVYFILGQIILSCLQLDDFPKTQL
jgi:hypothetical protein